MPGLIAIMGLDAEKFKKELMLIEAIAKRRGIEIKKGLENPPVPGGGGGGGGVHGGSMLTRHFITLGRELGRGEFGRAAGTSVLLVRHLNVMKYLLNPIAISLAAAGAALFVMYKWSGKVVESLTGLKVPDAHLEHIAAHLQKINRAAEGQKDINREIERTIDLYNSAAQAAGRLAEQVKASFEHERKMAGYEEEREMKLARTEHEKRAVREKYAQQDFDRRERERAAAVQLKKDEAEALLKESKDKEAQRLEVLKNTPSEEQEKQNLANKKAAADAAEKFLQSPDAHKQFYDWSPAMGSGAAATGAGVPSAGGPLLSAAEKRAGLQKKIDDAQAAKKAYADALDNTGPTGRTRERAADLKKQSETAAASAAKAILEADELKKKNATESERDRQETAAKLAAENAVKYKTVHGHVNNLQQIGAYTPAASVTLIDLTKQLHAEVKGIRGDIKGAMANRGRDLGKVEY